jgi:hypothetical protein
LKEKELAAQEFLLSLRSDMIALNKREHELQKTDELQKAEELDLESDRIDLNKRERELQKRLEELARDVV